MTTSWVAAAKTQLGIQAASQVWGNRPAWYLWLSGEPGTYQLQLADPDPDRGAAAALSGIFTVKCYPFADRDVYPMFSAEERRFIEGPWFDATHTPGFDHRRQIPDDLFNVAVVDYTADCRDRWVCLTLESLSTLRVVDGACARVERAVPGWRLGLPLFERLIGMTAFHRRRPPCRIRVARSAGFQLIRHRSADLQIEDAPDVPGFTASVLFGPRADDPLPPGPAPPDLMEATEETGTTQLLFDAVFPEHQGPAPDWQPPASLAGIFRVRRLWWALAEAEHRSNLSSTCGCDGHHHRHGIMDTPGS